MNTHRHMHWGILVAVTILVGNFLVGQINKTYLPDFSATKAEATGPMKPVLSKNDFRYLGAFAMPATPTGDSSFSSTLALRHVGGETHVFETVWLTQEAYELNVPALGTSAPYPKASIVKNWGYVGGTHETLESMQGGWQWGLYWDNADQRLYWSYGNPYNAYVGVDPSFGYSTLNDNTGVATAYGPWKFVDRGAKMSDTCIISIPQWFVDAYTPLKRLGAGCGGYKSVVATGPASMGPALTAFAPPDPVNNPPSSSLATTYLVGYPFNPNAYTTPDRAHRDTNYFNSFEDWNPRAGVGYWTATDNLAGQSGVWVDTPTKSGLIFFPTMTQGRSWYYNAVIDSELNNHWWFVYDPADLAQVAQGQKDQSQIQASSSWQVEYPEIGYPMGGNFQGATGINVDGVVFDPTTSRLYVSVGHAEPVDRFPQHMVYVYQVGDNIAPAPLPITSVPRVILAAAPTYLPETGANGNMSLDTIFLAWSAAGATSVSISPGVGTVGVTGTLAVRPTTTTTYTLNATNSFGTSTTQVTVTVNGEIAPAPAPVTPPPSPVTPSPVTPTPTPPSGGPLAPGAKVTDDFNRSNGTLGGNWITQFGGALVSSNQAVGANSAGSYSYWNANSFDNNQYSQFTIKSFASTASYGTGYLSAHVRASGSAGSTNDYELNFITGRQEMYRVVNNSVTLLGTWHGAVNPGDLIRLEVEGTTLRGYINGVKFTGDVTDSIITSGSPGIGLFTSNSHTLGDIAIDNWEGGNLGSSTTPTPSPLAGDLNSDGIVNSLDWSIMSSVWFTSNAAADLNHDGIVNSIDFSILNRNWFRSTP